MIEKIDLNFNGFDEADILFYNFDKNKVMYDIENNPFTNYYVYKVEDKIVGYINYQVMYERSELININVLDSYQGKGIASLLMERMFHDLKQKKVVDITLEVRIDNIKAINLYKKYDFKEVSIRKGYYQGIDGILMKKELM